MYCVIRNFFNKLTTITFLSLLKIDSYYIPLLRGIKIDSYYIPLLSGIIHRRRALSQLHSTHYACIHTYNSIPISTLRLSRQIIEIDDHHDTFV
jgi:hypothetical protein